MAGLRICVVGAGAMGGLLGGRLAAAGEQVSLIARGSHLAAMRANGLRLIAKGGDVVVNPPCTDDATAIGVQDIVILAVKANALGAAADAIQPLLGAETVLVPALNGVPWWYFYRLAGPYAGCRLDSVDPGGELWRKLPPERVIAFCWMERTIKPRAMSVLMALSSLRASWVPEVMRPEESRAW